MTETENKQDERFEKTVQNLLKAPHKPHIKDQKSQMRPSEVGGEKKPDSASA